MLCDICLLFAWHLSDIYLKQALSLFHLCWIFVWYLFLVCEIFVWFPIWWGQRFPPLVRYGRCAFYHRCLSQTADANKFLVAIFLGQLFFVPIVLSQCFLVGYIRRFKSSLQKCCWCEKMVWNVWTHLLTIGPGWHIDSPLFQNEFRWLLDSIDQLGKVILYHSLSSPVQLCKDFC